MIILSTTLHLVIVIKWLVRLTVHLSGHANKIKLLPTLSPKRHGFRVLEENVACCRNFFCNNNYILWWIPKLYSLNHHISILGWKPWIGLIRSVEKFVAVDGFWTTKLVGQRLQENIWISQPIVTEREGVVHSITHSVISTALYQWSYLR